MGEQHLLIEIARIMCRWLFGGEIMNQQVLPHWTAGIH
ncbi:hypothetical protein ECP03018678_0818 [Escherichia coli P0301867.8]|nr:hypothetical protein ECP03018678_0818 [Escherichia coli P0301867.8]